MKKEYLEIMCCPDCKSDLEFFDEFKIAGDRIESGILKCNLESCGAKFPISNFVPRFVDYGKYAESFGAQWENFASTQIDNTMLTETQQRWDSEIGWQKNDLSGSTIIEFGCGAGRFLDIVSKNGASLVVGVDITSAVDAAQKNLGKNENIFIVQADFFRLPFKNSYFDFAYSIGVLHHTPDPRKSFSNMVDVVNDKGEIGLSLYEISLYERPPLNSLSNASKDLMWAINMWRVELFRIATTRVPDKWFLAYCKYFVPILHYLNKIPVIRYLRYLFPSTCYPDLPVEWSMLDTNDTYATKIVHQYRHKEIFQWFMKENIYNIIVHDSIPGWVSLTGGKSYKDSVKYKIIT